METKKASKSIWKHVICCMILLVIFVLTIGMHNNKERQNEGVIADSASETVPLNNSIQGLSAKLSYEEEKEQIAGPKDDVTVEIVKDLQYYIIEYADTLKFFSKTFKVKYDDIIKDLYKREEKSNQEFEETNIGYLLNKNGKVKTFKSIEYGIVEYFYDYMEKHPEKINKKREPYYGDAKYVENLIIYYTTHIYTNVDTATALSIGAAESGYYKVKYMLKCNNIYGGMSSKGLIKYRNIEYGVLSYIRLLSKNYYSKGLNTVMKIGYRYCPKYDSNGNKIVNPHWVSLVNTAKKKYKKCNRDIDVVDLLSIERNA